MRDAAAAQETELKALREDREACLKFIQNEMQWCGFRSEFGSDLERRNASRQNAKKLEAFLDRFKAAERSE